MRLQRLIDWYQGLSPASLAELPELYHEQARFRDPFNDVTGQDAIAAIFSHMFENTAQPAFRVTDSQQRDDTAWVSWVFSGRLRGRAFAVEGVTRLEFAGDGRVIEHRDYWDSAELYVQLPMLGTIVRFIRNRMSAAGRAPHYGQTEP